MPQKKSAVPISQPSPVIAGNQQASFNIQQCAAYLGISPWQVRMSVWQGKLPARKVGRSLVILRSDADAFVKALPTVVPNAADWLTKRGAA